MKTRRLLGRSSLVLYTFTAAAALMIARSADAADGTWTFLSAGSATGTWSDAATGNWSGGIVADGSGSTADFSTLNITATSTIALGAARIIGNLNFADADTLSAANWTLSNGGSTTNTLTLAGTTPTITVGALNSSSLTSITAIIAGIDGLTKAGAGILSLSGVNTYTGGTAISAGSLRVGSSSALGATSGAVTVSAGAALQLQNNITVANTINLNGNGPSGSNRALTLIGGAPILSGTVNLQSASIIALGSADNTSLEISGSLNLGGNQLTTEGSKPLTLSGSISGTGTLNLTNTNGTTIITQDNSSTYSGQVNIVRSTLAVGNDGALGTGTIQLGVNDQLSGIRSTSTTLRTLANPFTITGSVNSTYNFGSTNAAFNGNLAFTNTTGIALGLTTKKLQVYNLTEFSAGFSGSVGITLQTGTGTLVLKGTNTYTGATAVNAGTLVVTGAIATSSGVSVGAGATLAGESSTSGVTNGKVSAITLSGGSGTGGVLAPGNGTAGDLGTLYGTSLAWNGATDSAFSQMVFDLGASNASDQLALSGAMTKGTGSIFEWDFGNTGVVGSTYTLVTAAGGFGSGGSLFNPLDFTYKNLTSGMSGTFTIDGGNSLNFTTFSAVPEPTSAIAGLLLGAGLLRRRRRA